MRQLPGVQSKVCKTMKNRLQALMIAFASAAVYANTLFNGFIHDDNLQVLKNPWITDPGNIPRVFLKGVWAFTDNSPSNYYRPMMHVFYIICYQLFGFRAWGYHLLSMALHAGVSVLFFLLVKRLVADRVSGSGFQAKLPFVAALLFAVHPIHTEAVSWVAGLPDLSFTFFGLLSLYLYTGSKGEGFIRDPRYIGSVLAFAASLFSKEPAFAFLAVIPAYDMACRPERPGWRFVLLRLLPFVLVAGAYMALRLHALSGLAPFERGVNIGPLGLAVNALVFFGWYWGKLLLPVNLNMYHILHPVSTLWGAVQVLSLLLVLACAAAVYLAYKRDGAIFLGLCLAVLPLLPVLYIPALGENAFAERYLYLPSAGLFLAFCAFVARVRLTGSAAKAALGVAGAVLVLFSAGTVTRNTVLKDDLTMWKDTVAKSPDGYMPHNNLGVEYSRAGLDDEAIAQFAIVTSLKPDYANGYCNLGVALLKAGMTSRAVEALKEAVRRAPDNKYYHNDLGLAYMSGRDYEQAADQFAAASRLDPSNADYRGNLWDALKKLGR